MQYTTYGGTRPVADCEGARWMFGPVAQWIEPPASNRLDGGSIPSGPATHTRQSRLTNEQTAGGKYRSVVSRVPIQI
jgi:hypothetical protein